MRPGREQALAALSRFGVDARPARVEPHGGGLINDSWLASFERGPGAAETGSAARFLLQRVNRHVFRRPAEVMANMERVTRHVEARLRSEGAGDVERRVLRLVPARDDASCVVDEAGETWRLLHWIERTRAVERARTEEEARATALAFGRFLLHLVDLPGPRLHETIPGFHDTPARLHTFRRALAADRAGRAADCRAETEELVARAPLAASLAAPLASGAIRERPVHNDAKIANVLFDEASGEALCVVDLDTVMPGLAVHDFGDLVRSAVSDSDEDERDLSRVAARPSFYRALVDGFVEGAAGALSSAELALLATGALVITYEQALRFLTDHLDGDAYYRVLRPGHNLDRARAQLALLRSLEAQRAELERP